MVHYFTRLCESMGITVSPAVAHYLVVKEKTRFKRHEDRKMPEVKKLRSKRLMDQLREETRKVIKGRAKKDGTYLSGMNMAAGTVDGYTLDDLLDAATAKKPAAKCRRVDNNIVCKHCKLPGHSLSYPQQTLPEESWRLMLPLTLMQTTRCHLFKRITSRTSRCHCSKMRALGVPIASIAVQ
jgi:hypothetical protein